ncbi:MAG TPA: hypothetical protein VLG47_03680 [Candidatus Saccharimonadales bacterium]|nr:hypothetical protein [Candidatus Saccharimonadales bacterium]
MKRSYEVFSGATAAVVLGLGIMACGSSKPNPEQTRIVTTMTPDMAGFLKPGSTTTCYRGGARPCAILIRTRPALSSAIINADPANQTTVYWPREAYKDYAGDSVGIVCYVSDGQRVAPYEGNSSSTDWLGVAVLLRRVVNPEVQAELHQKDPSLRVITVGGNSAVVGFVSVEDFGQYAPPNNVPKC